MIRTFIKARAYDGLLQLHALVLESSIDEEQRLLVEETKANDFYRWVVVAVDDNFKRLSAKAELIREAVTFGDALAALRR